MSRELVLQALAGRPRGRNGWTRADCPLCELRTGKPDRKQSLGLSASGFWHCQRCQARGWLDREDEDDVFEASLPERAADVLNSLIGLPESHLLLYELPGWDSVAAEPAREYLRARGVDDDLGFDARLGACLSGFHRGRVVVPVYDAADERLLGWSARDFTGRAVRKYLYPEGMRRGDILYNAAALAAPESAGPLYVVEGVFDALALWPDAVACLGKPTERQVDLLLSAGLGKPGRRPVVAALDGDAWRESEALALKLRVCGRRAAWVRLPPLADPATMEAGAVRSMATAALRAQAGGA